MRNIILVLLVLFCAANAPAAVWRVEKDGAGDFTVIQQAVDASASGDTILIGPGRYDDRFLWGNPPWQQYTRVLVTRSDLTLIGAGADRTIIGDAAPMGIGYDQDSGLAAHVAFGAGVVRISDIGFENCYSGAYFNGIGSASVANCRFAGNGNSINSKIVGDVSVDACMFESLTGVHSSAKHMLAWGPGRIELRASDFEISTLHAYSWGHVHAQAISELFVQGCEFKGGAIGINATLGSGVVDISDCAFTMQHNAGIIHGMPYGTVRTRDTTMSGQYKALMADVAGARWEVDGLVVEDVFEYSFGFLYLGGGYIRNSHLAKGVRYAVLDAGISPREASAHLDMTNNWWGTADPDSIQACIFDGTDQPARPYYFIDWTPFKAEPVETQKQSLGGVKSMFR
ncbi:MAG: hypothetical protein IPH86_14695 [bacterium]|nr:hypothetical protein [bacterium]